MKKLLIGFVLAFFCLSPSYAGAPITEQIAFASVRMVTSGQEGNPSSCSAVVIGRNIAYTAKHCLDIPDLHVDGKPMVSYSAYPNKDLAVVTVPGLACPCVSTAVKGANRGDTVYAVGFPLGNPKVTTRGEAQQHITHDGQEYLVAVLPALPGMSGGGVFSAAGRLLGVVSASAAGVLTLIVEL